MEPILDLFGIFGGRCTMGSFRGAGRMGMEFRLIWRRRGISVCGGGLLLMARKLDILRLFHSNWNIMGP